MSALISRAAILSASRLSNFAIQFISPILLVRILHVADFGQYQEFLIYAMILTTLCSFSIDTSLTYFIPRFPGRERTFVTQTSVLILGISMVIIGALLLLRPLFLNLTTYDFVMPLAGYALFFVNLNWLEYYWIATRKTGFVVVYSAIRLLSRISVLLFVSYTTRDVLATIWSMVVVEGCRVLLVFVYFSKKGIFRAAWRWPSVLEQLRFAAPIGTSAVIQRVGHDLGKLYASNVFGPTALAYYVVGGYLQPIIRVLRNGMQDAVYPELVRVHDKPGEALQLWRRVNVLNCVIFFPSLVLLTFYAKEIISVLFTSQYLAAVPVFNVYALLLIRRCFNADVLLRSAGQTGFMFWGAIGGLILNVALILVLSRVVGIIGPAIALVVAEVALEVYYIQRARYVLSLSVSDLADWRSIFRIALCCGFALPIPIGFGFLPGPELIRMAAASLLYIVLVFLLAYYLGIADIGRVAHFAWSKLKGMLER